MMMSPKVVVALLLLSVYSATAAKVKIGAKTITYKSCSKLGGGLTVCWNPPVKSQIHMAFVGPKGSKWVGAGPGTKMIGSTSIVCFGSGKSAKVSEFLLKAYTGAVVKKSTRKIKVEATQFTAAGVRCAFRANVKGAGVPVIGSKQSWIFGVGKNAWPSIHSVKGVKALPI